MKKENEDCGEDDESRPDLDDLLRVPHGVLIALTLTLTALLAVQPEHDVTAAGGAIEVQPEDDSAFHGRPAVATLLGKQ